MCQQFDCHNFQLNPLKSRQEIVHRSSFKLNTVDQKKLATYAAWKSDEYAENAHDQIQNMHGFVKRTLFVAVCSLCTIYSLFLDASSEWRVNQKSVQPLQVVFALEMTTERLCGPKTRTSKHSHNMYNIFSAFMYPARIFQFSPMGPAYDGHVCDWRRCTYILHPGCLAAQSKGSKICSVDWPTSDAIVCDWNTKCSKTKWMERFVQMDPTYCCMTICQLRIHAF